MDGWVEKVRAGSAGFMQRVRDGATVVWQVVKGGCLRAARFVSNHFIKFFLAFWIGASVWVFFWVVDLADPCRGTNLVCPDVEWIRPGYLAEDFRNLPWAASLVFGGAGAGAALINALRRTRLMQAEHALAQRGQDSETFSRAVNQLGSDKTAIRLGAIYALEGLMRSAFEPGGDKAFGRQIGETLAAFVRDQSVEEAEREAAPQNMQEQEEATVPAQGQSRLAVDRESAVAVLARSWPHQLLPARYGDGIIDLTGAKLARLWLPNCSDLRSFELTNADLHRAQLRGASLVKVELIGANLREAQLPWAKLQCAVLVGADLQEASLFGSHLQSANVRNARFQRADLFGANFQQADLTGADLRGARTNQAVFGAADISDAWFASPDGEDPATYLTVKQIESARWRQDKPPTLPKGMRLPHRGDGKPLRDPSPFNDSWAMFVGPSAPLSDLAPPFLHTVDDLPDPFL